MEEAGQFTPKAEAIVDMMGKIAASRTRGHCVFEDDGKVHDMRFRDALSVHEYNISGLCQACQDSVFGEGEEG